MNTSRLTIAAALPLVALAGCTAAGSEPAEIPVAPTACNAALAQSYVGQTATADLGLQVQRASGAQSLRWLPPRTAVTMEYRADRVGVRYDDAMTVTGISCG